MKTILGLLMVIGGIALGIYVGFFVMFIGGIVMVVEAFQSDPVIAANVAWGVARVVFAAATGWLTALLLILPGIGLIKS